MYSTFTHGYAVLVGVGESAYPKWSLPVTVKDIKALQSILTDPKLCAYINNEQHIRVLYDSSASRHAILDSLNWLKEKANTDSEATIIIYYSGHGFIDIPTGKYYLIPHDIEPFDIPNSALSAQVFSEALDQIPAKRMLVIIDSCHAQGMVAAKNEQPKIKLPSNFVQSTVPKNFIDQLKQGKGRCVFTSCLGQQKSWIRPNNDMSIYTYHLIEALQGAGSQLEDQTVRISHLMNYVSKSVPESAQKMCQVDQTPFFDFATEDFAVALLHGGQGLPKKGWDVMQADVDERISRVLAGRDAISISGDQNVEQSGSGNINIGNIGHSRDISIGNKA